MVCHTGTTIRTASNPRGIPVHTALVVQSGLVSRPRREETVGTLLVIAGAYSLTQFSISNQNWDWPLHTRWILVRMQIPNLDTTW